MEAIKRVAAAVGLPDFQYYVIPAAVPDSALEVTDAILPTPVLALAVDQEMEPEVATVAQLERPRAGLSLVRSVKQFVAPVAPARAALPFLLLADVATAVASARSVQGQMVLDAATYDAEPQRMHSGGRAAFAVIGRR